MTPSIVTNATEFPKISTAEHLLIDLDKNATNCPEEFPPLEAAWLYSMALITIIGFVITLISNGIIFYLFWR